MCSVTFSGPAMCKKYSILDAKNFFPFAVILVEYLFCILVFYLSLKFWYSDNLNPLPVCLVETLQTTEPLSLSVHVKPANF